MFEGYLPDRGKYPDSLPKVPAAATIFLLDAAEYFRLTSFIFIYLVFILIFGYHLSCIPFVF